MNNLKNISIYDSALDYFSSGEAAKEYLALIQSLQVDEVIMHKDKRYLVGPIKAITSNAFIIEPFYKKAGRRPNKNEIRGYGLSSQIPIVIIPWQKIILLDPVTAKVKLVAALKKEIE